MNSVICQRYVKLIETCINVPEFTKTMSTARHKSGVNRQIDCVFWQAHANCMTAVLEKNSVGADTLNNDLLNILRRNGMQLQ